MNWNFWGDPATWLWGGVWAVLVVGVWLVVKGVRGLRVVSTACAGCGYDLIGTVGGPCPECGRRDGAVGKQGRKRRWGVVGAGVAVITVAATSRVWVGPAADWIWWRVLPAGVYMGEYEAGGLRWRWWAMREGRESPRELWDYFGERHEVLHPLAGWTFVSEGGLGLDLFKPTNGESTDFDGDGVAETIVYEPGGDEEECRTFVINSRLRERPVVELECRPWNGAKPYPRDVDGDGIAELIALDTTFIGWSAHGELADWSSTGVPVVLGWAGSRFEVEVSLMRGAAMGSGMAPLDRRRGAEAQLFLDDMLDMMYSGNEAEAWAYFDRVWPESRPGKAKFKQGFLEQLERSPWWPKIREAYARGD